MSATRLHRADVHAAADRDALPFEVVDLTTGGDGEARPERVDGVDDRGVGERGRRDVDLHVGQLAPEGEKLSGDAVDVGHGREAAVLARVGGRRAQVRRRRRSSAEGA